MMKGTKREKFRAQGLKLSKERHRKLAIPDIVKDRTSIMTSMPLSAPVSSVLDEVKSALIDWYTFLCGMPHFRPDSMELPPPQGWPDVHVDTLKASGRSDEAIEFVRHLPYIAPCINDEYAWITSNSLAVDVRRGATRLDWYCNAMQEIYLPPHFLVIGETRWPEHYNILVDIQTGDFIEYQHFGCPKDMEQNVYDAIPWEEKWKAFRGVPAREFLARDLRWYTYLVRMPVPGRWGLTWYCRGMGRDEEDLVYLQDEYEAEHEIDSDYEEEKEHVIDDNDDDEDDEIPTEAKKEETNDDDGWEIVRSQDVKNREQAVEIEDDGQANFEGLALSSSDGTDSDVDMEIEDEELEWLRADHINATYQPMSHIEDRGPRRKIDEDTQCIYEIYKRNGWPYTHFDVEKCRAELLEAQQDMDAKRDAKHEASRRESEEKAEAKRRKMLEMRDELSRAKEQESKA